MHIGARFAVYAADFEKTYGDDNWERLRPHWHEQAVYEVVCETFPCRLVGPDAIFAGMKKSLDGFDRHFDNRAIAITEQPAIVEGRLSVGWSVTYDKAGCAPFRLDGRSTAALVDGRLGHLVDLYEPEVERALAAWVDQHGLELDPSYL